jgi:hypothetical protein
MLLLNLQSLFRRAALGEQRPHSSWTIKHVFYVIRENCTLELILGITPMNQYNAAAAVAPERTRSLQSEPCG